MYQDLSLISAFTAAENVFLGRELSLGRGPLLFRFMRRNAMAHAAVRGLRELHIDIPGVRGRPVERMSSGGQRQLVAIARAAFWGGKLLLLDEPTAALGVRELREVLELIARLGARGLTIVMVTHNLEHLWQVCTESGRDPARPEDRRHDEQRDDHGRGGRVYNRRERAARVRHRRGRLSGRDGQGNLVADPR